jgi:hypothetical protein
MASNADRSNDSSKDNDQSKQDNPFIKFRQFADSHIGSLLQGIIGLPSAFSKNTHANAKWADFDEDLRRRDELQARQRSLRDADAVHHDRWSSRPAGDIDATVPGVTKEPETSSQRGGKDVDSNIADNIPLYSPVYKTLFNQMENRGDSEAQWKPSNFMKSLSQSFLRPEYWPMKLRSDQASTDVMETIRYLAYNEINSELALCADYSLLPYLLFSSYSPLKLSVESHSPSVQNRDTFEYCAAFEDLIKMTSGEPLNSPPVRYSIFHGNPTIQSSIDGMIWIQKLYRLGLLQQKHPIDPQRKVVWLGPWSRPTFGPTDEDGEEAVTELEMYERFLNSLSSATGQIGLPADDIFAAIFKEGEASIQRLFKDLDSPENRQAIKDNVGSILKDVRQFRDAFLAAGIESGANNDTEKDLRIGSQDDKFQQTTKQKDPNRMVSSSTTSEHHTNEDGSVQTTVTVWKRFADGRESSTTTCHLEEPPITHTEERYNEEDEPKRKDQNSKTGWFWK